MGAASSAGPRASGRTRGGGRPPGNPRYPEPVLPTRSRFGGSEPGRTRPGSVRPLSGLAARRRGPRPKSKYSSWRVPSVGVTTSLLRSPAWVFRVFEAWSCRSAAAPWVSALLPAAGPNPTASGVGLAGGPPARRSGIRPRTWPRPWLPTERASKPPRGRAEAVASEEGKTKVRGVGSQTRRFPTRREAPSSGSRKVPLSGRPSPGCGSAGGVGEGRGGPARAM